MNKKCANKISRPIDFIERAEEGTASFVTSKRATYDIDSRCIENLKTLSFWDDIPVNTLVNQALCEFIEKQKKIGRAVREFRLSEGCFVVKEILKKEEFVKKESFVDQVNNKGYKNSAYDIEIRHSNNLKALSLMSSTPIYRIVNEALDIYIEEQKRKYPNALKIKLE